MLEELHVENLLLIERAHLRLAPGLNVLTGETGAGKTVLAHALDLLLGGRPRAHIVRPGAAEAYVEGIFRLPEPGTAAERELSASLGGAGEEGADEVVLARRVGADGRTRAYVNGRSASISDLRELGAALVSLHAQHEHRRLLSPAAQLEILDALCGEEQAVRLEACARGHARVRELGERLEQVHELSAARVREIDLLEYELAEIAALGSDLEEHDQLLAARERVRRADALLIASGGAAELLGGAVSDGAASAAAALEALAGIDPLLDALATRAGALTVEAQELSSELRAFGERVQDEALEAGSGRGGALESLEERLVALERVLRKHGGSAESVRGHERAALARREQLEGVEAAESEASAALDEARASLGALAGELRRARVRAAKPFAKAVREQLEPLAMAGASFEAVLAESELGPSGADLVEFVIAPNRGVPAGPLREIASGGELSRVMLAIMSVAQARGQRGTLVFDEVDAGIGGHTARAVGERVRALAQHRQVICITHLPQIASLAARHFTIVKDASADTARTVVRELDDQETLGEIVRMLGADSADSAARRHARDLLRAA